MKSYQEFILEKNNDIPTTIIILQIEEFRYFMFSELYGGEIKELFDLYTKKLEELENKYSFILPPDNVGFCTEFALNGIDKESAISLSNELYSFFKSFNPELTVNIVISSGNMTFSDRIQISMGEPLIKAGRRLDKKRNDGIEIV